MESADSSSSSHPLLHEVDVSRFSGQQKSTISYKIYPRQVEEDPRILEDRTKRRLARMALRELTKVLLAIYRQEGRGKYCMQFLYTMYIASEILQLIYMSIYLMLFNIVRHGMN
ncbi:hypothetical protein EON65_27565 [archaeon]|nr:MAG: hypothetical protein EON65_27565 [archaeon]